MGLPPEGWDRFGMDRLTCGCLHNQTQSQQAIFCLPPELHFRVGASWDDLPHTPSSPAAILDSSYQNFVLTRVNHYPLQAEHSLSRLRHSAEGNWRVIWGATATGSHFFGQYPPHPSKPNQ